jgi:hypothetical protein
MDSFPSSPVVPVGADLAMLRDSSDLTRIDRNVLIATWNLRDFGKALENRERVPEAQPPRKRNLRGSAHSSGVRSGDA